MSFLFLCKYKLFSAHKDAPITEFAWMYSLRRIWKEVTGSISDISFKNLLLSMHLGGKVERTVIDLDSVFWLVTESKFSSSIYNLFNATMFYIKIKMVKFTIYFY